MTRRVETEEQLAARGIDRWGFPCPVRPGKDLLVPLAKGSDGDPRGGLDDPARRTRPQAGPGSYAGNKLLCGLRRLCADATHGQQHTQREIAEACGVEKETIRQIEKSALKKVRGRLGKAFVLQIAESIFRKRNKKQEINMNTAQSKLKQEMEVTLQIHNLLLTVDENRREAIFKAVCILLRMPVN